MIPPFAKFLYPVLNALKDENEHPLKKLMEEMVNTFSLSETDVAERVPCGSETILQNRTKWATTYLGKAGLLSRPKRGTYEITEEGKSLLKTGIMELTPKYLREHYQSFHDFVSSFHDFVSGGEDEGNLHDSTINDQIKTPSEVMDEAFEEINKSLASELLDHVKDQSPEFFEQLVVKLLVAMGYGGSLNNAGIVTKMSHDDGIDGIIKEDKLGLDNIYIQAKRYTVSAVQKPEIQKFIGALTEQGATKGVFITTAKFSDGAVETSKKASGVKIVLIDGDMLTKLMIENNVGVSPKQTYEIKKIDTDFFNEE